MPAGHQEAQGGTVSAGTGTAADRTGEDLRRRSSQRDCRMGQTSHRDAGGMDKVEEEKHAASQYLTRF